MFKLAGWTWKRLRNKKGISTSLVEAGATIAVGLTLAAAIIPVVMDKGEDGSIARAQSDAQALATSIQAFFGDVQEYPSRERAVTGERDSGFDTVAAFRTGDGTGATAGDAGEGNVKDPSGFLTAIGSTGRVGRLNDHLVTDPITGSTVANYRNNGLNWKGPYSKTLNQDPWGRNYVVLARAASHVLGGTTDSNTDPSTTTPTSRLTPLYYWVLSAGPNGKLDTTQAHSELQGDDIGTVVTATKAPATSK